MQAPDRGGTRPTGIRADLILLHAPAVYDFRDRDDVVFAYLSDSDSVNVSPIYEMFPLGFLSMRQRLSAEGLRVEIVNLASLMLRYPELNVEALVRRLEAPVFGIDLHWLAHCHGSLEVARIVRRLHPDSLVLMGGLSATYYAAELIDHPQVDMVVQGYDTLEPLLQVVTRAVCGRRDFSEVPNLVYRGPDGKAVYTGFTYRPKRNYNNVTVDWSFYKHVPRFPTVTPAIMTLPNAGCAFDCPWCGGARYAYKNIMGVGSGLVRKDRNRTLEELRTLEDFASQTAIHALQCYSETRPRLIQFLEQARELNYRAVYIEQFKLPDEEILRHMGRSGKVHVFLSPESHEQRISRLAGRGDYSMRELEAWIPKALDAGIAGVLVWFFIGMPEQTAASVMETVRYSDFLLRKFQGAPVMPVVCPMVPFLDPGSRFFEEPGEHGYTVFFRSLEEHRKAMVEPVWHRRLNYQTKWLSRKLIQEVTYESVKRLTATKGELGVLPPSFAARLFTLIDETRQLLEEVERNLAVDHTLDASLRSAIKAYNRRTLAYSTDQIVPVPRPFGGRWFDDFTVPEELIRSLPKW